MRGELPGATSAVMELCVDNPREGFADLFATHPSVSARIDALVKFAGGHDPGPLPTLTEETEEPGAQADQQDAPPPLRHGPWDDADGSPSPPPAPAPNSSGTASSNPAGNPMRDSMGPWGRH